MKIVTPFFFLQSPFSPPSRHFFSYTTHTSPPSLILSHLLHTRVFTHLPPLPYSHLHLRITLSTFLFRALTYPFVHPCYTFSNFVFIFRLTLLGYAHYPMLARHLALTAHPYCTISLSKSCSANFIFISQPCFLPYHMISE